MLNMPVKKSNEASKLLVKVIEGILKTKGHKVVSLNLTKLPNAVSQYFVICHGTSKIQVDAIANSVLEETLKANDSKPWHKEGFENAEWILLDYVNVVVHIFLEETRAFYNIEKLWADAEIKQYDED